MANQVTKKFTWVIKDFSSQTEMYYSVPVLIGDYEWYLSANAKGDYGNSLYMGLEVDDSESLPSGWRRYLNLQLSVAKPILGEHELLREYNLSFDQKNYCWEFPTIVPLTKLLDKEEGFLVNGELMIVAEVEVLEVVGTYDCTEGAYQSLCEMKLDDGPKPCDLLNQTQESIDVNGFQVLPSQVENVRCIFERHPDIADGFRAKNQHLRKVSMNVLLSLIETLCQSLQDLSSEDLVDADVALTYVKDVGFKVDWLERKLNQVYEKKEKEQSRLVRLREMDDSLLKLKQKCSDLDALVKEEEAELSLFRTPLSFDDVV